MQKNKIGISEEITRVGNIKNNLIQIKNNIDNKFIEIGTTESNNLNEVAEKIGKIGGDLKKIAQGEELVYLIGSDLSENNFRAFNGNTGALANININKKINFIPQKIILAISMQSAVLNMGYDCFVKTDSFYLYTIPKLYVDSFDNNNEYNYSIFKMENDCFLLFYFDKITDSNVSFKLGIVDQNYSIDINTIESVRFSFKWIVIG